MRFISKLLKSPFSVILFIMVAYIAFVFYTDVGKLTKVGFKIDYLNLPLIIAPMTFAILLLAFRFHRFLRHLDVYIPLRSSIFLYIAGLSLAVTPGNSGQIIKSHIMKKQFDIAISKTSPIVLIEKWNELVSVAIVLVFLALFHFSMQSVLIIVIAIAVAIFLFVIMTNHRTFNLFSKLIVRFRFLKRYEDSIENSQAALKSLTSTRVILEATIITVPAIILQAISVYFAFQAMHVGIDFIASTQIFYFALIFGILSFIPGGFGVTEGSMLGLLIAYFNYNQDPLVLGTAVIFVRLVTLWYPTILGLITVRILYKRKSSISSSMN